MQLDYSFFFVLAVNSLRFLLAFRLFFFLLRLLRLVSLVLGAFDVMMTLAERLSAVERNLKRVGV